MQQVQLLRKVLNSPGMPILAEERLAGSKSDKATMHELVKKFNEVWDEEMFIAQYKDWFDLVVHFLNFERLYWLVIRYSKFEHVKHMRRKQRHALLGEIRLVGIKHAVEPRQ